MVCKEKSGKFQQKVSSVSQWWLREFKMNYNKRDKEHYKWIKGIFNKEDKS